MPTTIVVHGDDGNFIGMSHFYVEFVKIDSDGNETREFFGKYPESKFEAATRFRSKGITKDDYDRFKEFSQNDAVDKISREFEVSEEKFNQALNKAREAPDEYILGENNCVDFVQEIYETAGYPGAGINFSNNFSKEELGSVGLAGMYASGEIDSINDKIVDTVNKFDAYIDELTVDKFMEKLEKLDLEKALEQEDKNKQKQLHEVRQ